MAYFIACFPIQAQTQALISSNSEIHQENAHVSEG